MKMGFLQRRKYHQKIAASKIKTMQTVLTIQRRLLIQIS